MKLLGWVLRFTWLYRLAGWLARRVVPLLPRQLVYARWNVWGRQRELPPMPSETFRELYRRRRGQP
jgi:L-lactate dehydrogenase complex protein LldF